MQILILNYKKCILEPLWKLLIFIVSNCGFGPVIKYIGHKAYSKIYWLKEKNHKFMFSY